MDDESQIRLVVTHPEGGRCDQNLDLISEKQIFDVLPIRCRILESLTRCIAEVSARGNAPCRQPVRDLLGIPSREGIDDPGFRKRLHMFR